MRPWIDTGHLNSDSGAVGGGNREVDRNDLLADLVEQKCRNQGWTVGSTNENDAYTSLSERVANAAAFGADIFVSIHHDWTAGAQAVIYSNTNNTAEVYAQRLAGFINRRIDRTDDGIPSHGIYADRRGLAVLRGKMPSVVIEASRVQDPYVVENMATWIVQGLCDYYGVAYIGAPAPAPTPTVPAPAPFPPFPGRLLILKRVRMTGTDVSTWQQRMRARGWAISVDGVYGPQSYGVCVAFQKEKGLGVDGIVGKNTWNAAWTAPVTR